MTHRNTSVNVRIRKVEELLQLERYAEALDEFERLRSPSHEPSDPSEVAQLLHMSARCLYELGHLRRALLRIKAAGRVARRINDDSLYAYIKLIHGRILVRLGRCSDAMEEFTESYVFYRRTGDYKSLLFPLNSLAQLHFLTGDFRRSCELLELSLKYAQRYHTEKNVIVDKRNLARVYLNMGKCLDAETLLDSIDPAGCDSLGRAHLAILQGVLSIMRMELERAERYLQSARQQSQELGATRDLHVCFEYIGLLHYLRGQYRVAERYYQNILDSAEITTSAKAQTLRMLTDVHVAERKFKKALSTAKQAEEAITKINERRELGTLWRAYAHINAHKGDTQTARDYFAKSTDLLRQIGARYELALTYFACGQSECYDEHERLGHLHTARTHFVEMNIPKRVEQVDEAIANIRSTKPRNVVTSRSVDTTSTIIAVNPEMKSLVAYAEEVAGYDFNILLTGETGTGKDLLARHIHSRSSRAGEFIAVNAPAIPTEMIESELFGYRKGAFTGATEMKPGLFEAAEGGTFYLNEIAGTTTEFQVKLLEVLETRRIRRLGENQTRSVNFRLIAASNRDLEQLISESRFQRDLYHRLKEVQISLPPLRDRLDDIPALVKYFVSESKHGILITNRSAMNVERIGALLSIRDYPGNVRELKAKVNELILKSRGDLSQILALLHTDNSLGEREQLERILESTNWNKSRTAWIFGVSEGTIRNRIRKYGITRT